jgi:hypothetical protein
MSEKKILSINPDLFSFSNTTKKKKEPKQSKSRIQIKPSSVTKNGSTLRKKTILKMIRQHQTDRNSENFSNYKQSMQPSVSSSTNDFETAKNFFSNMVVDKTNKDRYNYTLKKTPAIHSAPNHTSSALNYTEIDVNVPPVDIPIHANIEDSNITLKKGNEIPIPKYGCMKNGLLPTYRTYMNQTRRNSDEDTMTVPDMITRGNNSHVYGGGAHQSPSEKSTHLANIMSQTDNKLKNLKKKKRGYKKKTVKRSFVLGKSKIKPSVSVLVTNKTVRNNIVEKTQLLRQTPLTEIRKYLMQHGFIKVGTVTPNDVLRKMYETALLICGEVQNHNSDTLMYNFLNNNNTT